MRGTSEVLLRNLYAESLIEDASGNPQSEIQVIVLQWMDI
jgi:hypothetical protein